jgi:hypothetical protein
MKHSLLISLCFLPLALIFIFTKLSLWLSSSAAEVKYVKDDELREHGSFVEDPYRDIDKKNETDRDW